jgi:hypoxanthine phosphoribosyltransferase
MIRGMPNAAQPRPTPPRVLIAADDLQRRVAELAADINRDYAESDRLICVGVLKGSVFFLVDLVKRLDLPVAIDFFQTSSYGGGTSPGEVRIRKDLDLPVRDADVLLVEDIVDTGYTLRTILDLLRWRGARSVRLCALLDKASRREVEVPIAYRGFAIEDLFVVGYGLDYAERYRNLPYIGVLEEGQ